MNIRWLAPIILLLALAGCAQDETATTGGGDQASNPLVGTWKVYNDPSSAAHWIFDPTFVLYQEEPGGLYLKHSYGITDSQLVIRSGTDEGSYGFTHDENQLTLVETDTSRTIFFTRVSDRTTPPGDPPP